VFSDPDLIVEKLLDLEDDLHDFPNEETWKFKILDMVCGIRNSENIDKDSAEKWLHSYVCEVSFQHDRQSQCCHKTKA
jgi:hypothetical protein